MKKLHFNLLAVLFIALIIGLTISCEEDDETKESYNGVWVSSVYPIPEYNDTGLMIGIESYEKMEFTFTNSTFENKVFGGEDSATAAAKTTADLIMAGDIKKVSEGVLEVTIKEIEIPLTGAKYSNTVPSIFDPIFEQLLGERLKDKFEADYVITGNTMVLTIPLINPVVPTTTVDTELNLTKVE